MKKENRPFWLSADFCTVLLHGVCHLAVAGLLAAGRLLRQRNDFTGLWRDPDTGILLR